MNLQDFLNYKTHCIVCNNKNIISMRGMIKEQIDEDQIQCRFHYFAPVITKEYLTFSVCDFNVLSSSDDLDLDTFNSDKYSSFALKSDDYILFDRRFQFKMKLSFDVMCEKKHHCYTSRTINLSDKSPNITKGYPVVAEQLSYNLYQIISYKSKNITYIYDYKNNNDPVIIPYKDISIFPIDDKDKFEKKVQNILLLA